jgi:hypothetical protein
MTDLSDEKPAINTNGLEPCEYGPAAGRPKVAGVCPSCGCEELMLFKGGLVSCVLWSCDDRLAAARSLRAPGLRPLVSGVRFADHTRRRRRPGQVGDD